MFYALLCYFPLTTPIFVSSFAFYEFRATILRLLTITDQKERKFGNNGRKKAEKKENAAELKPEILGLSVVFPSFFVVVNRSSINPSKM